MRNTRPISNTRSKPPTTSRFSGSSSAIRMYMSTSSALWCVMNGRAAAPPAWESSTGVSTSVKPRSTSTRRTVAMTDERMSNVRRVSGSTIRSR